MKLKQVELLKAECQQKPKLRTFLTFKDFGTLPPHVGKPLTFLERKLVSKLRLGILPIRVETARYLRPVIPENQRLCYCNNGEIESEFHFLFTCPSYKELRHNWLEGMDIRDLTNMEPCEKFKLVLYHPENVRQTAQFVVKAMDLRSKSNLKY